jgi:two-component system cell cycle sensor histidine kinase/response regulator CckA
MSDTRDPGLSPELLFDRNPNPMWTFDARTLRFLSVNEAAIERYGYSRDELLAMTIRDIRPAVGVSQLDRWLANEPGARNFPTTTRHQRKDGSVLDVEIYATPFDTDDGPAWLICAIDVTARKRAEAAARRLTMVVEKGADGLVLSDREGKVLYASPAVGRMSGLPVEQLVGRHGPWRMHPDDLAREAPRVRATLQAPGATHTMIARHQHGDGSWRWIEATLTNLLDDPAVAAVVTTTRDVTARVEAEDALRDARARLAQLLGATSAVTWSLANGGRGPATFVGENVRDLLGFEPQDFLHDPNLWWSLVHPDDVARVRAEVGAFLADRGPDRCAIEYRLRRKTADYRWIRDEVVARRDEHGAVIEIIGCWIDIHARREMEEALRRSEASFRTLTEHLPLGALVHREGVIVYANRATAALLGYPDATALRGSSLYDLGAPAVHETIRRRIESFRRGTPSYHAPESGEMVRRDGTRIEVEAEAIRIDFDGAPAMLLLLRNLTERHEMVARLAVADRMRSVGMLAAGVAHEINNPLSYVLANLDLLATQLPAFARGTSSLSQPELQTLLDDAREGATRVRDVVRDLRTLSRAEDEPTGAADLRQVLESCFKLADSEIRYRARLVTELAPAPPARGSASRLAQVFLNLLINAAHAIPGGHADDHRITVRLRTASEQRVVVEIADTGVGIAPSIVGRIFEPFFTTKPTGEGTGLGLAICHGIVKSVGGDIDVESEPGRGTTFRVSLPIADAASAPAPELAPPITAARRARILVIDDEPAIGNTLRLLLENDHEVVVLTRAPDALARISDGERYDAILCDLMMPEMSGIALHAAIAATAPELLPRMVFMTGGAFTREAQDFVARCEHPPIQKPFELREISAIVDRLVHATQ